MKYIPWLNSAYNGGSCVGSNIFSTDNNNCSECPGNGSNTISSKNPVSLFNHEVNSGMLCTSKKRNSIFNTKDRYFESGFLKKI